MKGTVVGNWIIGDKIGEGGMGQVYLATHKSLGNQAAIKVLFHALANDQRFRERFYQEAQSQSSLQHPNIAQVLDYVEQDGQYFLVVEYFPGGTLADYMDRHAGPVNPALALRWIKQSLLALDYAHQNRIIHRDIKPSNIMLDGRNEAHVVDFGIALVMGGRRMTSTGMAIGTAEYMSPEQITNPKGVDHRTDVYSMGIVLYEMLTGRIPFEAETEFIVKAAQVNDPPPPPCSINPSIPAALEQLVMKALAKDPNYRYVSCGEFLRVIEAFEQTGQGPVFDPVSTIRPKTTVEKPKTTVEPQPPPPLRTQQKTSPKPSKSGKWILALAAVLVLIFLAGGAGVYYWMNSPSKLDRYFKMRDALETNRPWSQVESEYRQKVGKGPSDTLDYGMLIEALMRQHKYAEAEKMALTAISKEPNEPLWSDLLGDALSSQSKKEEAEKAYKKAADSETVPAERHVYSGDNWRIQGNNALAETDYREAVKLKPDRPLLKIILADILEAEKKWPEAESLIREAIRLSPNNASHHGSLASNLLAQEKTEEAEREAREAVRLNSYDSEHRVLLGRMLEKQNKTEDAITEYKQAVELNPQEANYHNVLGVALGKVNRWDEAEIEHAEAVKIDPDNGVSQFNLGVARYGQEKWASAETPLREAVRLESDYAPAHGYLALTYFQQEKWAPAERSFRRAIELDPENAYYQNRFGRTLIKLGDPSNWGEAELAFRRATEQEPNVAAYHSDYGDALVLQLSLLKIEMKLEAARDEYQKAVDIEPNNQNYIQKRDQAQQALDEMKQQQ